MKKGQEVVVYDDWQCLENKIGEGRLIRKVSEGLPFILFEEESERHQKVYSYESWIVEINGIRQLRKIRKNYRKKRERYKREDYMTPSDEHNFITIFGRQVF